MSQRKVPWKNAATLIVAAPKLQPNKFDYNILCMKRTSKSSFFPSAYVFPGGALDNADRSPRWFEIFKSIDPHFVSWIPEEFFVKQNDGKRSPLFPGDVKSLKNGVLPNEIAFRICAIRESFEESGLLLLTDNVDFRQTNPQEIQTISRENLLDDVSLKEWRTRVHDNAYEFLNLCEELKHVPDVWSLKEWFEWLTPNITGSKDARRYDTVFYSCCLGKEPQNVSHDETEMEELAWLSPGELLKMHNQEKIIIKTPQLIELSRLMNFRSLKSLQQFMTKRALKGMRRTVSLVLETSDGIRLEVLFGDDLYPQDLDEIGSKGTIKIDKTCDQIMLSKNQFRIIFKDRFLLVCNVIPDYDHVAPLEFPSSIKVVSKL